MQFHVRIFSSWSEYFIKSRWRDEFSNLFYRENERIGFVFGRYSVWVRLCFLCWFSSLAVFFIKRTIAMYVYDLSYLYVTRLPSSSPYGVAQIFTYRQRMTEFEKLGNSIFCLRNRRLKWVWRVPANLNSIFCYWKLPQVQAFVIAARCRLLMCDLHSHYHNMSTPHSQSTAWNQKPVQLLRNLIFDVHTTFMKLIPLCSRVPLFYTHSVSLKTEIGWLYAE